ncbi:MAG: ATP-binding protein, partial [Dethiobacteria bacterium]|nr:ATP-binding protein [Dethiobacteria bacterium]
EGAKQWGQVMPFSDAYGLSWLIVTVIPETDFMAQINRNNQVTFILMLLTLVVTVIVSVFITRKIINPITGLNAGARSLAEGKWEETIPQQTRIEEIQTLANSFNHMASQLSQMVNGLTYEVTERKKTEEELALLNSQLKAKNQELEQLIYIASHDLRSPLVNIDGYGRELEYSVTAIKQAVQEQSTSLEALKIALNTPSEEIGESLHYIRSSTLQMDALLKGMLKLSRTGRMSLTIGDVDMNVIMAQVITSLDYQLQAAEAEVTIASLPPCRGDSVQISQVFLNVIANAIKFLDPERPGFIRISGDIVDKKAIYCVEDNGIGIAAEEREKIFEVFVRLNPQNGEGEGLGLTIVRQVLGRLGGAVWVESTPGEGSRFYLTLPAVRPGDQKKKRGSKVE